MLILCKFNSGSGSKISIGTQKLFSGRYPVHIRTQNFENSIGAGRYAWLPLMPTPGFSIIIYDHLLNAFCSCKVFLAVDDTGDVVKP